MNYNKNVDNFLFRRKSSKQHNINFSSIHIDKIEKVQS